MLIHFTEQCMEGCSHCMANATPAGKHMDIGVFNDTMKFLNRLRPANVQVSGGEFTLHPDFHDMVCALVQSLAPPVIGMKRQIILESNGSFIEDIKKTMAVKDLISRGCSLQVRTHPEFYPNYQKVWFKHRQDLLKITPFVFNDGIRLMPFGRAKKNHAGELAMKSSPPCSNMFLLSRQCVDLMSVVAMMETHGFLCKPLVGIDGRLHVGETVSCQSFGHVTDNLATLFENLKHMRHCDGCGLAKNLAPAIRRLIGRVK